MATIGNINVAVTATTDGLNRGLDQAKKKLGGVDRELKKVDKQGKRRGGGGRALAGAAGVAGGVLSGRSLIRASDEWTTIRNKVATVTNGVKDQESTMNSLVATSQRARADLGGVAAVFQRFAFAGKNFKTTNKEALRMVETLFKIGVVGGVTGQEMRATLIQLSQGFGKGKLDGIELTSVMEQMAPLAQLIADHFGIAIGALKDFGAEGRITSEVIKQVLSEQAGIVDEQFKKTVGTIAQEGTKMNNMWTRFVGLTSDANAAQSLLGHTIQFVTNRLKEAGDVSRRGGFIKTFQEISDASSGDLDRGFQADRFFGPNNPLTPFFDAGSGKLAKLEEANSKEIVAALMKSNEQGQTLIEIAERQEAAARFN